MSVMKLVATFAFVCLGTVSAFASTFVVDFDPSNSVNTAGWDLNRSAEQKKTTALPAGRKLTDDKEEPPYISSPVYESRIKDVAISFKGSGVGKENEAILVLAGRDSASDDYKEIFTLVGIPGTLTNLTSETIATALESASCRQIKISYEKNPKGTLVIATVTITDDAIRAETPTNLKITASDVKAQMATVGWDLAPGLTNCEYRTFTTTEVGGIDGSNPIWRESFDQVPSRGTANATKVTDTTMSEWNLSDWEYDTVYNVKVAGVLVIGWDKAKSGDLQEGTLTTPPFATAFAAGHQLVVRAKKEETTKGGNLPIYKISNSETNLIQEAEITSTLDDYAITLPELATNDRLLFHSSTATNTTNRKTMIDDIAICAPESFIPRSIKTNEYATTQSVETNAVSLVVPSGNTNLYFQVRTIYGGEKSEWSAPILISLLSDEADDGKADAGDGDKGSGGESGGDTGGATAKITAPGNPRVGSLPDGKFRIGWETPDTATNVHLKIWTLSQVGGISESSSDDILWCETFADAPATNTTVRIDNEDKFNLYTDKKSDGWNVLQCVQSWLSSEEKSVRIGTGDYPGALESTSLNLRGENIALVVKAKRGSGDENSGVILHAAMLTNSGTTTNEIGTAAMTKDFTEYSFAISDALIGTERLLLTSEIASPKDGRIIIDDIAFVRNYKPVTTTTNEFTSVDFSDEEEYDFSPEPNTIYYAALCAQDANGETSEWTERLDLDPASIEIWKDHHLTLDNHGKASATLDIAKIYDAAKTKLNVADEPFRFLIDDAERLEISNNKNVEKATSSGIYVCTNVFARDWIVLVPMSAESKSEIKEAEMRVAIETENFAAQKISITGTFAQLGTRNQEAQALLFQWRWIPKDGEATDWIDFGSYETRYTESDMSPDLEETIETVTAEATLRLPEEKTKAPTGARIEVRILAQRHKSEQMAPIGFRDVTISAEKAPGALLIIIK